MTQILKENDAKLKFLSDLGVDFIRWERCTRFAITKMITENVTISRQCDKCFFQKRNLKNISGYYGRLRLLTRGQLTDPSANTPFTKATTISETLMIRRQIVMKESCPARLKSVNSGLCFN